MSDRRAGAALQAPIEFEQSIRRRDYLRLTHRRWPEVWAQKTGGLKPAWWLRWLAGAATLVNVLRRSSGYPVVHRFAFSEAGVQLGSAERSLQIAWSEFTHVSFLGSIWVLCSPARDLPIFSERLPKPTSAALRALIERHVEPPKHSSLIESA